MVQDRKTAYVKPDSLKTHLNQRTNQVLQEKKHDISNQTHPMDKNNITAMINDQEHNNTNHKIPKSKTHTAVDM